MNKKKKDEGKNQKWRKTALCLKALPHPANGTA